MNHVCVIRRGTFPTRVGPCITMGHSRITACTRMYGSRTSRYLPHAALHCSTVPLALPSKKRNMTETELPAVRASPQL